MKHIILGNSGINISELCLGSLTMSPLQRNLSIEDGGYIIYNAIMNGITFIDAAEMYGSYQQIKYALDKFPQETKDKIIIASKSTKATYNEMRHAIEEACVQLGRNYIDIFLMHALKSPEDYKSKEPALKALIDAKNEGIVKMIGASSHKISALNAIANDTNMEMIHCIVNYKGFGLTDGTLEDLLECLTQVKKRGGYVYAMKPLGGGYLRNDISTALKWLQELPLVDSIAIGVTSQEEILMNIAVIEDNPVLPQWVSKTQQQDKRLFVNEMICSGCGNCESFCEQNAIKVLDGKAKILHDKCILCAYCNPICPNFAIRII